MPNATRRFLILDTEAERGTAVSRTLEALGHSVRRAPANAEPEPQELAPDAIILFAEDSPERAIAQARALIADDPHAQVVVVVEGQAMDPPLPELDPLGIRQVPWPFAPERLAAVAVRAAERRRKVRGEEALRRTRPPTDFEGGVLPGTSPQVQRLNTLFARVALSPATPVLLMGEPGTGKARAAEALHRGGSRAGAPLVRVNCSAIPRGRLEAELFGEERDGENARPGLLELADGGTAVLAGVAALDSSSQMGLLRLLLEGVIQRAGSSRSRRVDVRVIATSSEDLAPLVAARRFREDLFFRLAVMRITLPALRERQEDIPLLAMLFLQHMAMEGGHPAVRFGAGVLERMRAYRWPGNVRELRNVVERLLILVNAPVVDVPEATLDALLPAAQAAAPEEPTEGLRADAVRTLDEVEKEYLREAMQALHFNKSMTARRLGISRSTLRRKLTEYGLDAWVAENAGPQTDDGED